MASREASQKYSTLAQSRLKRHLRPKTIFLAVHRHNDTVYCKRFQPGQFRLLSAFQAKATLAAAGDELPESGNDYRLSGSFQACWTAPAG